jgi:hypothetical protein
MRREEKKRDTQKSVCVCVSVPQAKKEHESSNFFFRFRRRPLAGTGLHGCREWGALDVSGSNLQPS